MDFILPLGNDPFKCVEVAYNFRFPNKAFFPKKKQSSEGVKKKIFK